MSTYRLYALPWDASEAQDRAFRRLLAQVIAAFAVATVVVSLLPVAEPDRGQDQKLPPRLARLVLDKPAPPPPPPVVPPRPTPAPPEPTPVRPPVETAQRPAPRPAEPVTTPPPVVEPAPAPEVVPEPAPEVVVDRQREAREEAAAAGLLPLADELASLRDNAALGTVTAAEARIGSVGDARRSERALLTRNAAAGSAGVDSSALSRDTGGSGLADRETTRVAGTVAGMRPEDVARAGASAGPGGVPARSREEIELVFDQNKGAIYSLYSRALRSNPGLQGKLVLQLTIEPSGEVSSAQILSSELGDEALEQRLLQRIRMFRFDDRDVARAITTKPIDFFPA